MRGVRVGLAAARSPDLVDRAVAAAAEADAAVVVVGTNDDWETEGDDRAELGLPGAQDELVRRVVAANPRTVVVVNAGRAGRAAWADDVAARSSSLVRRPGDGSRAGRRRSLGDAEPCGRLPTTFPRRIEDTPAFGNFPGENGQVRYAEGVLMGYRWYDARRMPVRFPFGHGLSYTTFALGPPRLSASGARPGRQLSVEVDVTNTGARAGSEVVQLYVAPAPVRARAPAKGAAGVRQGRTWRRARRDRPLTLASRAFAYWDPGDRAWPELRPRLRASPMAGYGEGRRTEAGWRIDPGAYKLHVGRSCADIAHVVPVRVIA